MKTMRSSLAAACLLVLLTGGTMLHAQDRLDPVAMGKGRASVATVRGIGAIASNPGAIDLGENDPTSLRQKITFTLFNFGGTVGSTYFNTDEFRQIFSATQKDPQPIGKLFRETEQLFVNAGTDLFSVRYKLEGSGTLGLHYGQRVFGRINFPERLAYFIETLNISGQDYRFTNDSGIGADWVSELGVTYGKRFSAGGIGWLPEVGAGVTAKLMQGIVHFEVEPNSIFTIDQIVGSQGGIAFRVQGGYSFRSAEPEGFDRNGAFNQLLSALPPPAAGLGFGLDAGLSGVLYRDPNGTDILYFGLALQDIGSIVWNTNTYQRTLKTVDDTVETLNVARLRGYEGKLERVPDFSTPLPSRLRVGLGANLKALFPELSGPFTADLEGEFPLNNVPGNPVNPRLALGGNWALSDRFALRSGISVGGTSNVGIGLGAGIHPIDWLTVDIGTSEINALFNGKRVDLALRVSAGL
jgi:hypothetical protein